MEQLKASIAYTCGKTIEMYGPLIEHQVCALSGQNDIKGKPFQILGFDLLIGHRLKAWVLEVNDHPSLNIYFDTSTGLEKQELTEEDICQVDLHVKSRLVTDVVGLARKKRDAILELSEFGSLTKVHPESITQRDGAVEVDSIVRNLRTVMKNITPMRNKLSVTAQVFEKLYTK